MSSRYVAFEYLPFQLVGLTWESNAQIGFGARDDRWTVSAYVFVFGSIVPAILVVPAMLLIP